MDKIKKSDIDFSKTKLDTSIGFWANSLYIDYDNNKFYKMFSFMSDERRHKIEDKLEAFSELDKEYVSNPIELIYDDNGKLMGYSQRLINGKTLFKTISDINILKKMKILLETSKNLEDLHKNNVVVCDMHFDNIMVNEYGKPFFIDIDSFQINGIEPFCTSSILSSYYDKKGKKVDKSVNSDIIGFYLCFFERLFKREIYSVKLESYNNYMDDENLKKLYPIFFELNKRSNKIPEVPYLHKVLKNYDNS